MIREVDLVSYLPPFLAEYEQTKATLEAENPEFAVVWDATDRILQNMFISTADEYGISRFEKILRIHPSKGDSPESRRLRVLSKWFDRIPYTWGMLIQKLSLICGVDGFKAHIDAGGYKARVCVRMDSYMGTPLREMKRMLEDFMPASIVLLLYAEYVSPCKAPVDYANTVLFRGCFHPRFNRPALRLDRAWKMAGGRKLSGYDGQSTIDLYPVSPRFRANIDTTPLGYMGRLRFPGSVGSGEDVGGQPIVSVKLSAKHGGSMAEQLVVRAPTASTVKAGDIRICNMNRLNGGFKLNGRRKLNGGMDMR